MAITGRGKMNLISFVFLFAIVITAMVLVLSVGIPLIDSLTEKAVFDEAKNTLKLIDNAIRNLKQGSSRLLKFNSPAEFEVIAEEDSIQFKTTSSIVMEYFSRKLDGNLIQISGADVDCYDDGNLTLENSFIKISFQKIPKTDPLSNLDTRDNIRLTEEKTYNTVIYPVSSSIIIDDDPASSSGSGYSEISKSGYDLPSCQVHFHVNSTVSYDIYYILYAGADFVVIDIRNVE